MEGAEDGMDVEGEVAEVDREEQEGDEEDLEPHPMEDMILLESSYSSGLHPLPPNLPHFRERSHHHQHAVRDRRRSKGDQAGLVYGLPTGHARKASLEGPPLDLQDDGAQYLDSGVTAPAQVLTFGQSAPAMMRSVSAGSVGEAGLQQAVRAGKRRREEDGAQDMYETNLAYQVNPASKMLKKVTKCVTTKDWKVRGTRLRAHAQQSVSLDPYRSQHSSSLNAQTAWQEIKLARTMEKIEQLKEEEKWSFRQRKKFRGPAIAKSHWDYMLDEMVR